MTEIEVITCSLCECMTDETVSIVYDNQTLCPDCANNEIIRCEHCGNTIWNEDNEGGGCRVLCQRCYEDYYICCNVCDAVIHNDDAYYDEEDEDNRDYPYCYRCYENSSKNKIIKNYNYKPSPIFHGEGLFLGVELELDDGGESNSNAEVILDIANKSHEHIYIKRDGSISDGFEIVTHPMSLSYHKNEFDWQSVLAKAIGMGYRSHQSGSCGLHAHVNRDALGVTLDEQEDTIARILYLPKVR